MKATSIHYLILLISGTSLILLIILLFNSNAGSKKPVPEKGYYSKINKKIDGEIEVADAMNMTGTYRALNPSPQTCLVTHKSDELITFIKNFDKYTAKVHPPAGYEWKISFAPMYFTSGSLNKLTFSILPCLVESGHESNVIDFWYAQSGAQNDTYYTNYFKPLLDSFQKDHFKSFIFDEGHLWP